MNLDVLQDLMMDDDNTLLTPTTLATFSAEFIDPYMTQATSSSTLTGVPGGSQGWTHHAPSSTFSANDDDDDDDDYDDDDDISLDSNSNFAPAPADVTSASFMTSSKQQQQGRGQQLKRKQQPPKHGGPSMAAPEQKQRKLPGPRPSRTLEEMTPLEAERRRRRRERNKNAAAKCRQRRVEQTNELLAETEKLEQESTRLEREIENLRRTKNQLEFVLDAHKPTCTAVLHDIKLEPASSSTMSAANFCPARPTNLPISSVPTTCRNSLITSSSSILDGMIFSFDTPPTGLTPMMLGGDLSSPSSLVLLSPSTLIAQQ